MKHIKYLFIIIIFSAFFTGCLQVNTNVNLNKDGSGTIEEIFVMKDEVINMMKEFAMAFDSTESEEFNMFNETDLKAKESEYGKGVKYLSGEKITINGYQGFKAIYAFEDINKLTLNPNPDSKVPFGDDLDEQEDKTYDDFLKFDFKKGDPSTLVINFPKPEMEDKIETEESTEFEDSTFSEEEEQKIIEMFDGMKIEVAFNFNDPIKETDASFVNGNKITLMEVDFSEVIKNKEILENLQKNKPETMEEFKKVIGDVPGIKVEFKEQVIVKF
jgi:hypothetical protein